MRALFILLWRNNFTLLFLFVESFCFYLLVQNNDFQNASMLNASNAMVGKTMEGVNYVKEYIHLKDNNIALAEENARLRNSLKEATYQNDTLTNIIRDTINRQQYSYITAKVINNSVNRRNNYLTLDKGSLQGIKPEMGVICSDGIVGIVKQVSPHFCTVMSLLHKDTRLSAKIKRNDFFGSLIWEGGSPFFASLKEIDKTVPVQKGDTINTTAFSSIFPAGIMIGRVTHSRVAAGSNFHDIEINLSTQFQKLSHVYVIDNILKDEQRTLEVNNTGDDH